MGWGRRRGEQKKKKKIPVFYLCLCLSLFPVKFVRLCTYLCGLVHFSYLLLCISPWLRVSIYYETLYIHPPAATSFSLSPLMKSAVLALLSPLFSFLLFLLHFEPLLHLFHKFPPTYPPTLLKSRRFRTNSPPIPPTAPPYPSLVLINHITHYILPYHVLLFISFLVAFHISFYHLPSCRVTTR